MTTTELIKILQDNEKGGISYKPRNISLFINGQYMPNPQISLSSTGDGICGPEIDLDIEGDWLEQQTRWIPVSERLPENFQRVLVTIVNYNDDKVVRVAEYHDRKRMFQIKENHEQWEVGEEGLLAWTPMPEPYQSND